MIKTKIKLMKFLQLLCLINLIFFAFQIWHYSFNVRKTIDTISVCATGKHFGELQDENYKRQLTDKINRLNLSWGGKNDN